MTADPLQYDLVPAPEPEPYVPAAPCTIFTTAGHKYYVEDVDAWEWNDYGLFATGRWSTDPEEKERDTLFPIHNITHVEYDFDELRRFLEQETNDDSNG